MAMTDSTRADPGATPASPLGSPQIPPAGSPSSARVARQDRAGWGWLALLVPMLFCCGGPLIIGAVAAASAATLGAVGGVVGAVLLAVAVTWWMRRRRRAEACCMPAGEGWRR